MTKLNAYLDNLEPKQWLYLGSALALLADILIIIYIYGTMDTFLDKELIMQQLIKAGYPPGAITQTEYLQFRGIIISNLKIVLNGFLLLHAIIYFCSAIAKNWAIKYTSFYAISSALLAIIAIFSISKENLNIIPFAFVALLLGTYYCLRKFRNNKF